MLRKVVRPLACAAFVVASLSAADAGAFCRTTTQPPDPSFTPSPTEPCWTGGLPLYWTNACVGYAIQQDASRQVSFDDAQRIMAAAFSQWTNASCPNASAGSSKASIDVRFLGGVACHQVQYNQGGGNANIIMFDDDQWPHNDANNTLGLTTVTYNKTTGELYDADMEINTAQVTLTVNGDVPPDGFDFQSIVTHESGHFLGLAHSPDANATMFAHYTQGSTSMRNLSADDVQGICTIYAPDGTRSTADGGLAEGPCDPTPRHGFSGACGGGGGCAAAPDGLRAAASSSPLAFLAALAALARSRRRWRAR